MPEDVGGRPPFPDGDEPDSYHHGEADEEFASVVLDEDFVRAARVHEPTAVERMVAAAQARAEAEAAVEDAGEAIERGDYEEPEDEYGPYGEYGGRLSPYRGHAHWQRPVALLLAVLLGVGIVALVFTAVYRSSGAEREDTPPPGNPPSSTSAESGRTPASAVPR